MQSKAFIIQSEGLGRGDDQLGLLLMANFLRLLSDARTKPSKIIFWNGGVKLCCEGSKVLGHIQKLNESGVEILACTTCLEFYDLLQKLKVGTPTTMAKSIESMNEYEIIVL